MSRPPSNPCIRCHRATELGSNIVTYYGELGDMCPDCAALFGGTA